MTFTKKENGNQHTFIKCPLTAQVRPTLLKIVKHRITNFKHQKEPYYYEIGVSFFFF